MKLCAPSLFFNFTEFRYKKLFESCENVWDLLGIIPKVFEISDLLSAKDNVPRGTHFENAETIYLGKNTIIEPGAYIRGPCIIGDNSTIRHGAYLRGNVIIGNDCVVGHSTEIKNSIFLDRAHAGHFNYIGDSVLGNDTNLGAGAKCANLRLDHGEISVVLDGKKVATGRKKLGIFLGDGAQMGCNAVSNPGTLVGKKSFIHPCVNFGGVIPEGKIVHAADKFLIS